MNASEELETHEGKCVGSEGEWRTGGRCQDGVDGVPRNAYSDMAQKRSGSGGGGRGCEGSRIPGKGGLTFVGVSPDLMLHACHLSSGEAEAGEL